MRRASVLLAIALVGLYVVGCGSSSITSTPAEAVGVESASVPEAAEPPIAEVTSTVAVDVASTSVLESTDLTAFIEAWNSGEVDAIRAFYADGAAYLSDEQVIALQRKEPVSVLVADEAFVDRVREHEGLRMRILGEPIQVYDKLVGFAFRREGDSEGYDGVALLRYEDGRILIHTYSMSAAQTPNPADDSVLKPIDLSGLMEAWSAGDVTAVKSFYTETSGLFPVFNDEDIVKSLKGVVHSVQGLAGGYLASEVRSNAVQWGMVAVGQPLRLGDLVLYAWSWEAFDYPVGYGVRFMRYDGDKINADIRFAIRPWEARGQSFISGY